jgi:hypothetical protein
LPPRRWGTVTPTQSRLLNNVSWALCHGGTDPSSLLRPFLYRAPAKHIIAASMNFRASSIFYCQVLRPRLRPRDHHILMRGKLALQTATSPLLPQVSPANINHIVQPSQKSTPKPKSLEQGMMRCTKAAPLPPKPCIPRPRPRIGFRFVHSRQALSRTAVTVPLSVDRS